MRSIIVIIIQLIFIILTAVSCHVFKNQDTVLFTNVIITNQNPQTAISNQRITNILWSYQTNIIEQNQSNMILLTNTYTTESGITVTNVFTNTVTMSDYSEVCILSPQNGSVQIADFSLVGLMISMPQSQYGEYSISNISENRAETNGNFNLMIVKNSNENVLAVFSTNLSVTPNEDYHINLKIYQSNGIKNYETNLYFSSVLSWKQTNFLNRLRPSAELTQLTNSQVIHDHNPVFRGITVKGRYELSNTLIRFDSNQNYNSLGNRTNWEITNTGIDEGRHVINYYVLDVYGFSSPTNSLIYRIERTNILPSLQITNITNRQNIYQSNIIIYGLSQAGTYEISNSFVRIDSNESFISAGTVSNWIFTNTNAWEGFNTLDYYTVDVSNFHSETNVFSYYAIPVIYIGTSGHDSWNGSWKTPKYNFQSSVAFAASNGVHEIRIGSGCFDPSHGLNGSDQDSGIRLLNLTNFTINGGWDSDFYSQTGKSLFDAENKLDHLLWISNCSNIQILSVAFNDAENGAVYLEHSTDILLSNILITNQKGLNYGGAIHADGLTNARFMNMTGSLIKSRDHSAVHIQNSGNIRFVNSRLSSNFSGSGAGAVGILNSSGIVFLDSVISQNSNTNQTAGGGAVGIGNSEYIYFTNVEMKENSAVSNGGAVVASAVTNMIFKSCRIDSNESGYEGGAFAFRQISNIVIDSSVLMSNRNTDTHADGGGMSFYDFSDVVMTENVLIHQHSKESGGAVYLSNGNQIAVSNCVFSTNSADDGGSVFYVISGNDMIWSGNTYRSNQTVNASASGGVFYIQNSSGLIFSNEYYSDNTAGSDGGVFNIDTATNVFLKSSKFYSNTADSDDGGAVYETSSSNLMIDGSFFFRNQCGDRGSVIYGNLFHLINSIIVSNQSGDSDHDTVTLSASESGNQTMVFTNNYFEGNHTDQTTVIKETGSVRNHVFSGNFFKTNNIRFLYRNYNNNDIATNINQLNDTNFTDALPPNIINRVIETNLIIP